MITSFSNPNKFEHQKIVYFGLSALFVIIFNFLLIRGEFKLLVAVPALLVLVLMFIYFEKYYLLFFVISLGFSRYLYWDYRIQFSTIMAVFMLLYFLVMHKSGHFSRLKYPRFLRILLILFVCEVFISSFMSKHFTSESVIYALQFMINVLLMYVIFRSVKNDGDVDKFIGYFILVIVISSLICLAEMAYTGYLRSVGLIGYAIMDFAPFVLLIYLFRNYFTGKTNLLVHLSAFLLFILTILHQSRFAWLGFLLAFSYGLIIYGKYFPEFKNIFKKKIFLYFLILSFVLGFLFISGYNELITSRISEINLDFFQGPKQEDQYLSNSLESRILIWVTAYNAFIQQPFFGIGFYMFPVVSEEYNVLPDILFNLYVKNLDVHTTYFNYLTETGLFGLALFVSFAVSMYVLSLRSIRMSLTKGQKINSFILNVYAFFVLVQSIYSGAFSFGLNSYHMWFMYALIISNYMLLLKNYNPEPAVAAQN